MERLLTEKTEKTTTEIELVSSPDIPSFKYFVKIEDFDRDVLKIMFFSFLVVLVSFIF